MDISVVIPVRDEAQNIPELVRRLGAAVGGLTADYELIFVTDINRDGTYAVLKSEHQQDPRVKVIKLSNSFGHHVAVLAGLRHAGGGSVVIMDGDLQDLPEDIPKLHATLREGYDVVYGVKRRKNDTWIKNACSKLFVRLMSVLSDYSIAYNTCMFRIISRRTVTELLRFGEREPSLTFIMALINLPTTSVEVTSGRRESGRTKFGPFKLVNIAVSSLMAFSTKPLRVISLCGFVVSLLSFIYLIVVLVQTLAFGIGVLGWPTIITLITFLGGIQLFGMGIIGEYIGRIFLQTKQRPLYIVEEKLGDFS